MARLAGQVTRLCQKGITLVNVMVVALSRGIQPLQDRARPMWEYNGVDDSTRTIRGKFYEGWSLKEMLASMFKGKASDFSEESRDIGFAAYKPIRAVCVRNLIVS